MHHLKQAWLKATLVGIASLIATMISFYDHFPVNFISVVTVFVLIQLFLHEIYSKTLERILGPLSTAIISAIIIFVCQGNFMLILALLAALVFVCIYFYTQKNYPYSMVLGAVTTALMAGFVFVDSNAAAYNFALYWIINIMIGALIVVVLTFIADKILSIKHAMQHAGGSHKQKFAFNPISGLVALRVLITLTLIIFVTDYYNYDAVMLQAVIAGVIVAAQLDLKTTHHRLLFRALGVLIGSVLAILYGHLLSRYPSIYLAGGLIVVSLMLFTFLSELTPRYLEYMFLQAGVMIPLILMDKTPDQLYNLSIAIDRGMGAIVGGVIAVIIAYIFYWPIKKLEATAYVKELK